MNSALIVAAVAGVATIVAAPWGVDLPALPFVSKPLATLALIAYALPRGRGEPVRRRWLLGGLWCSLAGDVALLWPQGFLAGLVSFLLAHLAYLVALTRDARFARPAWPFALYAGIAGAVLAILWPGVPEGLRGPVIAYVLALGAMAAQAMARWRAQQGLPEDAAETQGLQAARRSTLARRAAVGAALFMLSDALLATNRFAMPLAMSSLWVLGSYWIAQAALAASLSPPGPGAPPAPDQRAAKQ